MKSSSTVRGGLLCLRPSPSSAVGSMPFIGSLPFRSARFGEQRAYSSSHAGPVVGPEWVKQHLGRVTLVDATWSLKKPEKPHKVQIPGAVYFDIDDIADKTTQLPHMLPTPEFFEQKMNQLGIHHNDDLLIYDNSNGQFVASARVWWTFRVYGHRGKISVLEGGFQNWPQDVDISSSSSSAFVNRSSSSSSYKADFHPELVVDCNYVTNLAKTNIQLHQQQADKTTKEKELFMLKEAKNEEERAQILDARPKGRFEGKEPEPRPGIPSGHIPYSISLPHTDLFHPSFSASSSSFLKLKPKEELVELLVKEKGVDLTKPIITSCGSGVTASVLALALETLGKSARVFDGSWTEYASRKDTPKQ
ncbi:Sulfurtransferase [Balamuthia mandrillaris]